jgi:hypothetical protein
MQNCYQCRIYYVDIHTHDPQQFHPYMYLSLRDECQLYVRIKVKLRFELIKCLVQFLYNLVYITWHLSPSQLRIS